MVINAPGQFSADGRTPKWDDAETKATLDLCLSCKACKSECPSNVDIAKLKAEYTAQGLAHGASPSLATRLIANVRTINRLGASLHSLANLVSRLPPMRAIGTRLMGFHPQRELPRFGQSLYRWMSRRTIVNPGAPAVILFPDCFTTYNEPHIGRAAVTALEAFGYRVVLPNLGCCGRTYLSTGMLREAQHVCRATALALLEAARRESAVAVVVCEPSCVSAIKDEWLELDMGADIVVDPLRDLAAKSFLVEQFLEAHWQRHPRTPEIDVGCPGQRAQRVGRVANAPTPPGTAEPLRGLAVAPDENDAPIVLHGHCHQKALWGVDSSAKILRRFFGERLRILDSGCCGMAGQWGYQRDHYDLSMKIGEQSLFASLRGQPDAIVLAPGTSCRQQIHDGMNDREALHPIEIIAAAITRSRDSVSPS